MVRPGSLTAVTLDAVPVSGGLARLGSWGTLELTGAKSAVLRLNRSDDVELPEAVAADVTGGVLLLNDLIGRLLFLPYAGDLMVAYDLKEGKTAYPAIAIARNPDYGLRMATVRVLPGGFGVIHLTEATLSCFRADCTLAWRHDEDFAGWTVERTILEVHLKAGDWSGREQRQTRTLVDGTLVD